MNRFKNFLVASLAQSAMLAALIPDMQDLERFSKKIRPMAPPKFKRYRQKATIRFSAYPKPHQGMRERARRKRSFYAVTQHEREWTGPTLARSIAFRGKAWEHLHA